MIVNIEYLSHALITLDSLFKTQAYFLQVLIMFQFWLLGYSLNDFNVSTAKTNGPSHYTSQRPKFLPYKTKIVTFPKEGILPENHLQIIPFDMK